MLDDHRNYPWQLSNEQIDDLFDRLEVLVEESHAALRRGDEAAARHGVFMDHIERLVPDWREVPVYVITPQWWTAAAWRSVSSMGFPLDPVGQVVVALDESWSILLPVDPSAWEPPLLPAKG